MSASVPFIQGFGSLFLSLQSASTAKTQTSQDNPLGASVSQVGQLSWLSSLLERVGQSAQGSLSAIAKFFSWLLSSFVTAPFLTASGAVKADLFASSHPVDVPEQTTHYAVTQIQGDIKTNKAPTIPITVEGQTRYFELIPATGEDAKITVTCNGSARTFQRGKMIPSETASGMIPWEGGGIILDSQLDGAEEGAAVVTIQAHTTHFVSDNKTVIAPQQGLSERIRKWSKGAIKLPTDPNSVFSKVMKAIAEHTPKLGHIVAAVSALALVVIGNIGAIIGLSAALLSHIALRIKSGLSPRAKAFCQTAISILSMVGMILIGSPLTKITSIWSLITSVPKIQAWVETRINSIATK
ncbi:MAG: hypothetical protein RL235_313 [Chlamydiota bacterium]